MNAESHIKSDRFRYGFPFVGRVGLEPTWFEPGDFKSPASANSATAPDSAVVLIVHSMQGRSRLNYLDLIKKGYLPAGVDIPE